MKFLTYFPGFSYTMIAVAMLALVLAGGLSYGLALIFLGVMIVSWSTRRNALATTRTLRPRNSPAFDPAVLSRLAVSKADRRTGRTTRRRHWPT